MLHGAPDGSFGTFAETQSVAAGIVVAVTAVCSWSTPKPAPPNSPAMMARCAPGATALPEAPAARLLKSGVKSWTFEGPDHVPGEPDVKVAPDRFTKTTDCVASIGARPIPVLQSSAVESRKPAPKAEEKVTAELYTAPVMVLMIWNWPGPLKVSTADRMRCRTGSTETFSLVWRPNKPIFVPNVLGGVKGSSAPTLLESPSAI